MSKHHKHKRNYNNYSDNGMNNQNPYMMQNPNNMQQNNMQQNNMQQNNMNPFTSTNQNNMNPYMNNQQNNQNPFMGQNNPLQSLFSNNFNDPLLRMLGNIDLNLLAKLLMNPNQSQGNQETFKEDNNDQDSISQLLKNLDEKQVQDLLKNVDENQINQILDKLNLNINDNDQEINEDFYDDDNTVIEVSQKKYKAVDIIMLISSLLNQENTEFLDKVMEIHKEYI